jgi:hypothetical protein
MPLKRQLKVVVKRLSFKSERKAAEEVWRGKMCELYFMPKF